MTKKGAWNYQPEGAVETSPMFMWPLKPVAILRWFGSYWLAVSTTTLALLIALVVYPILIPPLETMVNFKLGWMARVFFANFIPHCLCAGILHYWLYTVRGQGKRFKYDARDLAKSNGTFTFGNQIHDNMFWTLASGIPICASVQILIYWAMANGYAPTIMWSDSILWFCAWFFILPIWSSFHFYWVHRLLHWPPLYRRAHSLHHRNVNVGPWSGISMHPIEHLLYFTTFLIHLIVPSHPMHLLFHSYIQTLHPIFSHSGFDKLYVKQKERAQIGDFFHQLHHKYFECNYGTVEMPWDKWFGSFHDGSDADTVKTRARKKQMYLPKQ